MQLLVKAQRVYAWLVKQAGSLPFQRIQDEKQKHFENKLHALK